MPYLQLDVPHEYPIAAKQRLARRFGEIYGESMQVTPRIVTVAIRQVGDGGLWRCTDGDPFPAALLMCDIRQGRSAAMRAELAKRLLAACEEILGLPPERINVEFTQHAGDEMYHPARGGLSRDWAAGEGDAERRPAAPDAAGT